MKCLYKHILCIIIVLTVRLNRSPLRIFRLTEDQTLRCSSSTPPLCMTSDPKLPPVAKPTAPLVLSLDLVFPWQHHQ